MGALILSDIKNKYIYPMSNSTNGGAIHSEYNVRSALSNLLTYSAANTVNDFKAKDFEYIKPSNGDNYLKFTIDAGKGNCNSYFVSCDEINVTNWRLSPTIDFIPNDVIDDISGQALTPFGCYLCISYNNNIADNLQLVIIPDSEYDDVFSNYKSRGFNDIGIKIFTFDYCYRQLDEKGKIENVDNCINFTPNPNITRCIDLSRIGSQAGLLEELQTLIRELPVLNIFEGDFFVSNYGKGEDDKWLTNQDYRDIYGGDYRLRLHLEPTTTETYILDKGTDNEKRVNVYQFSGCLDFVKVDEMGTCTTLNTIITFNTTKFSPNGDFKSDKSGKWPIGPSIELVTFAPDANMKCKFNLVDIQNLNVIDEFITKTLIANSTAIFKNSIILTNSEYVDNSSTKVTMNMTVDKDGTSELDVGSSNIRANKIYGAVWM